MSLLFGTTGDDDLDVTQTGTIAFGGTGLDTITGNTGASGAAPSGGRYYGSADDDRLFAEYGDRLFGGGDNDYLDGKAGGDNRLYGGEGDDTIIAGSGDVLAGGDDADKLWIAKIDVPDLRSTILGFEKGTDKIVVSLDQVKRFEDLELDTTTSAGDTLIKIASSQEELSLVKGVDDLAEGDFELGILRSATDLGTVPVAKLEDSLSSSNPVDYYKFTTDSAQELIEVVTTKLSEDARLTLIDDVGEDLNIDPADLLIPSSDRSGSAQQQVNFLLKADTVYYLELRNLSSGDTDYDLTVDNSTFTPTGDAPVSGVDTTNVLTPGGTEESYFTNLSGEQDNFYKFELSDATDITLTLDGLSPFNNATLILAQDANDNGIIEQSEIIKEDDSADGPLTLTTDSPLTAGTYFAIIARLEGVSNYTLTLENNNLGTAIDLGTLSAGTPVSRTGESIGGSDPLDFYKFTPDGTGDQLVTVNIDSTETLAASLAVVIDDDGDPSTAPEGDTPARLLPASSRNNSNDQEVNLLLEGGETYYIKVNGLGATTPYNLTLSSDTFTPTGTAPVSGVDNAIALTSGVTAQSYFTNLDGEKSNFYTFDLAATANPGDVTLELDGLSAFNNATLILARDTNGNGIIEQGEIIKEDDSADGPLTLTSDSALDAGTYFAIVERIEGVSNYDLDLTIA